MLRELHLALPGGWHVVIGAHPLMAATAVATATLWAGRRLPPGRAWVTPMAAALVLAGARGLFWLVHGGALLGGTGLSSMGGVVLGLAGALPLARVAGVPAVVLLDALVPAGVLALGIGRFGCLLAGCCYGAPSTLPWALAFPGAGAAPRHPLQLYSAAVDLLLAFAGCRRPLPPGAAAVRTLAGFAGARFALEWLRDARTSDAVPVLGMTLAQVACLALLGGLAWVARQRPAALAASRSAARM